MRKLWFLSHEKLYWIFHTLVHNAPRQGSSVLKHNFEKPANVSNVSHLPAHLGCTLYYLISVPVLCKKTHQNSMRYALFLRYYCQ